MKNKKTKYETKKEAMAKVIGALELDKQRVYEMIKIKETDQLWSFYYALKKEYEMNKIEYNYTSMELSNKQRVIHYQTLIYKQGCLKMFEYALGFEEKPQEDYVKPQA